MRRLGAAAELDHLPEDLADGFIGQAMLPGEVRRAAHDRRLARRIECGQPCTPLRGSSHVRETQALRERSDNAGIDVLDPLPYVVEVAGRHGSVRLWLRALPASAIAFHAGTFRGMTTGE
jgi:hypothetical protein